MREYSTYATASEINAICKLLRLKIVVYEKNMNNGAINKMCFDSFCDESEDKSSTSFLIFENYGGDSNRNHYNALLPIDNRFVVDSSFINRINKRFDVKHSHSSGYRNNLNPSYTSADRKMLDKFSTSATADNTGSCLFEAILNAFEAQKSMIDECKGLLNFFVDDQIIDEYAHHYLNAFDYRQRSRNTRGDNFELFLLSKITFCKICVLEGNDKGDLNLYEYSYHRESKFSIYFKRFILGNDGHIEALIPKYKEKGLYTNFDNYYSASKIFTNNLLRILNGSDPVSFNKDPSEQINIHIEEPSSLKKEEVNYDYDKNENDDMNEWIDKSNGLQRILTYSHEEKATIEVSITHVCMPIPSSLGTLDFSTYQNAFGKKCVKFSDISNYLNKDNFDDDNFITFKKDIYFDDDILESNLIKRYDITERISNKLKPCICMGCSGKTHNGDFSFKLLPNLSCLRKHADKKHNKIISKNSIINLSYLEDETIFKITSGALNMFYLIKEANQLKDSNSKTQTVQLPFDANVDTLSPSINKDDEEDESSEEVTKVSSKNKNNKKKLSKNRLKKKNINRKNYRTNSKRSKFTSSHNNADYESDPEETYKVASIEHIQNDLTKVNDPNKKNPFKWLF
jgi:hypothetical protein